MSCEERGGWSIMGQHFLLLSSVWRQLAACRKSPIHSSSLLSSDSLRWGGIRHFAMVHHVVSLIERLLQGGEALCKVKAKTSIAQMHAATLVENGSALQMA